MMLSCAPPGLRQSQFTENAWKLLTGNTVGDHVEIHYIPIVCKIRYLEL